MNSPGTPEIRRLTPDSMDEVLRIHLAAMGYTLNARLGLDHLRYLYMAMAVDPGCFVGVAHVDGQPAGVVSGTIDAHQFSARLMRRMPARRLMQTLFKLLVRPRLIWLWVQGNEISRPVRVSGDEVHAVLTAIVVDPQIQGRGIGRALVAAFEEFLREAGVRFYRLDTQAKNHRAAHFYRDLGFIEVARRADSIILARSLTT